MSMKDAFNSLALLAVVIAVVALYCYARVDLGMTAEQVNQALEQWFGKISAVTMLIWSQIIVAAVATLLYRVWRHRAESSHAE